MKLLLDTHTFIWWANEPEKLSEKALVACQGDTNTLMLSVVSVWEMQIKMQMGKLKISRPVEELVKTQQRGECQSNCVNGNNQLDLFTERNDYANYTRTARPTD
jgi:PIN domain nuclease of toxin-antitoxin system